VVREDLSEEPREIKLKAGDKFEVKNSLAVLASGRVDISKKSAYLKTVRAPAVFGVATLFDSGEGYISTLEAKTEALLLLFSEKFVEELIEESPEFSKRFILLLGEKIRYLNHRIDFYTSPSAEGKLHEYLEVNAFGEEGERYVEISMSKLSEILGIGRASLYRALSSLEEKGLIKKQNKKIILLKRG
jgi:CRP-like cAMP-binding protein